MKLLACLALVAAALVAPPVKAQAAPLTKVLVFSKTSGFRHSSIPNGIAAIQQLGSANGFSVTATEDATQFATANLAQYQAVIWLSTTGDGGVDDLTVTGNGRYLRVMCTQRALPQYGCSIWELEVFGN